MVSKPKPPPFLSAQSVPEEYVGAADHFVPAAAIDRLIFISVELTDVNVSSESATVQSSLCAFSPMIDNATLLPNVEVSNPDCASLIVNVSVGEVSLR